MTRCARPAGSSPTAATTGCRWWRTDGWSGSSPGSTSWGRSLPSSAGAPERAVARVDLGAVERNCGRLRELLTGGAELCAVVKADGYGHGAVHCARAALAGGATWLAVATAREADELRQAGVDARLLVMGALTPPEVRTALAADADVVAWTPEFAAAVPDRSGENRARVH